MVSHIKVIAILHIVMGGLGVLFGLMCMLFFGGIAGIVGATEQSRDALMAIPILGSIGGIIFVILLVLSLPSIIAGIGLLQFKPWARTLTIVLSALHLFNIPFGTALGVYGFWALLSPEAEPLFRHPNRMAAAPRY